MYATGFHYQLFFILLIIALPGLILYLPKMVKELAGNTGKIFLYGNHSNGRVVTTAVAGQALITLCIFSMAGVWLSPAIHARFVFFEAIAQGRLISKAFEYQVIPALIYGSVVAFLFIAAYYFLLRPDLPGQSRNALEKFRRNITMLRRVAFEPIFDEVVFRWGVQSIFTWVAVQFFAVSALSMWIAIIFTALFYGAAHLPVYRAAGAEPMQRKSTLALQTKTVLAVVVLYFPLSVACGVLFWKVGLLAAILAHMTFTVIVKVADDNYDKVEKYIINKSNR